MSGNELQALQCQVMSFRPKTPKTPNRQKSQKPPKIPAKNSRAKKNSRPQKKSRQKFPQQKFPTKKIKNGTLRKTLRLDQPELFCIANLLP